MSRPASLGHSYWGEQLQMWGEGWQEQRQWRKEGSQPWQGAGEPPMVGRQERCPVTWGFSPMCRGASGPHPCPWFLSHQPGLCDLLGDPGGEFWLGWGPHRWHPDLCAALPYPSWGPEAYERWGTQCPEKRCSGYLRGRVALVHPVSIPGVPRTLKTWRPDGHRCRQGREVAPKS